MQIRKKIQGRAANNKERKKRQARKGAEICKKGEKEKRRNREKENKEIT